VLSSAFALFAERGFDGTTTKEIASCAGVNEVTLFRHYGSKEALFRQVVFQNLPMDRVRSVVDFDDGGPLEEMLVRNAQAVLEVLKENRHIFMMLVGEVWRHPELKVEVNDEVFEQAVRFLAEHMKGLMTKGRLRPIDAEVAARTWIGVVQSHYLMHYLVGPGDIGAAEEERLLRGMADIFVNGAGRGGRN